VIGGAIQIPPKQGKRCGVALIHATIYSTKVIKAKDRVESHPLRWESGAFMESSVCLTNFLISKDAKSNFPYQLLMLRNF
jgi:hypothetical protein